MGTKKQKPVNVLNEYAEGRRDFTDVPLLFPDVTRGIELSGCDFSRQSLGYLDFTDAILTDCTFDGCGMYGARFRGADLTNCDFTGTNLEDADFEGANLRWANFYRACLIDANMENCDLYGVMLNCATITGLKGVQVVGPVGMHKRTLYAYIFEGRVHYRVGCNNEPLDFIRGAIKFKYNRPGDEQNFADYMAALDYLEAWGTRQLEALGITPAPAPAPVSTEVDFDHAREGGDVQHFAVADGLDDIPFSTPQPEDE